MQFDKLQMFQDNVAIATASTEVDTGSANAESMLLIHASGTSVAATGDITITLTSTATSGSGYADDMTVLASAAELDKGLTFSVPNHAKRYLKVDYTGTSISGNVTTGMVIAGQTNL